MFKNDIELTPVTPSGLKDAESTDDEDVDGAPIKDDYDDDVDGKPLSEEDDIDGMPMDVEKPKGFFR